MPDQQTLLKITNKVDNEIGNICKLYNKDFNFVTKQEHDMYVEIFQSGVKFMEKMKGEFSL